ncbi:MAG: hypothetical protein M3439_10940 [Chloroflexota bacterium]|nr:hypothetical protein [Chloroflexota bacterium]
MDELTLASKVEVAEIELPSCIVIWNHSLAHGGPRVQALIAVTECQVRFLPPGVHTGSTRFLADQMSLQQAQDLAEDGIGTLPSGIGAHHRHWAGSDHG